MSEDTNATASAEQTSEAQPATVKRGRGRPSKPKTPLSALIGLEGEFTIKTLAGLNANVKEYEIRSLVRDAVTNGILRVAKELTGLRGKPTKVYTNA